MTARLRLFTSSLEAPVLLGLPAQWLCGLGNAKGGSDSGPLYECPAYGGCNSHTRGADNTGLPALSLGQKSKVKVLQGRPLPRLPGGPSCRFSRWGLQGSLGLRPRPSHSCSRLCLRAFVLPLLSLTRTLVTGFKATWVMEEDRFILGSLPAKTLFPLQATFAGYQD